MTDPAIDERLWFTMKEGCCPGKHYLLWNPHTFPGRMRAWCPVKRAGFNVSKSEIETCSIEARWWINGFLAGNEPPPPLDADGNQLADDDSRLARWRDASRHFPETGIWVEQERHCSCCGVELLPTQPGLRCPECVRAGKGS